jgi:tripartite-type tricarboxylate transporter receptor subunit TctC
MMIKNSLLSWVAAAAMVLGATAHAQSVANYPNKPLKIVVPFPAGGTSDVLARIFGQKITEHWGQPVVVENRPGSSGNLGADLVAKAAPDGYTLVLMDVGNLVISPALFKLPFNVINDFAPVAMVAYSPHLLAVSTKAVSYTHLTLPTKP